MSLADLIRGKRKSVPSVATLTVATSATVGTYQAASVATVAPVTVANYKHEFDVADLQNQVIQLAGHSWQQLAASMTPERWANIAELMASADDGARFLSDWTARNILALNIARGVVSSNQTRAVICRACGPVFTHRTRADDPTGQDGSEQGLDCVLSCEWCGRGVPNQRPELGGMVSCF